MNNIKNTFTINDLENISGIKAHTIRIWEKRYQLFEPERKSRNVRHYDIESLRKILNIALLNDHGLKISKIAQLSDEEIIRKTREYVNQEFKNSKSLNALKLAMYTFDTSLFNDVYVEQMRKNTFSEVFEFVFVPLLDFIGLLWQTDSISPAHEHFMANLIYQKIQVNTENLTWGVAYKGTETYILYLPEEEMHEIGILYLNYELLLRGFKTIYLGRSIPVEDLAALKTQFDEIIWISQFTVSPTEEYLKSYLVEVEANLLGDKNRYWAISKKFRTFPKNDVPKDLSVFDSIRHVLQII